jgi:hypothetical protein
VLADSIERFDGEAFRSAPAAYVYAYVEDLVRTKTRTLLQLCRAANKVGDENGLALVLKCSVHMKEAARALYVGVDNTVNSMSAGNRLALGLGTSTHST